VQRTTDDAKHRIGRRKQLLHADLEKLATDATDVNDPFGSIEDLRKRDSKLCVFVIVEKEASPESLSRQNRLPPSLAIMRNKRLPSRDRSPISMTNRPAKKI
jgi:hypothetical protein